MNATLVSTAAEAILAAQKSRQTAAGIASALDAAGYLQTPGEVRALNARIARYTTAWKLARTRALSAGGAADRYAARARELQHVLQDMVGAQLVLQMQRDAALRHLAELDLSPSCDRCRCTEELACEGGCSWVPNPFGLDLCSQCITTDGRCTTPHCGTYGRYDGTPFGWVLVDIAGSTPPARFHCSPWCASLAIQRMGMHMADRDRAAAAQPEKDTSSSDQLPAGESTPALAYLARHEGEPGPMGWYSTPEAARAHCEAFLSAEHPAGTALVWDWIEDDEDGVAELVATVGKSEQPTGYCVIAVELQAAYDPEAEW